MKTQRKVLGRAQKAPPFAVATLVFLPSGIPLVRDPRKGPVTYWKFPGGAGRQWESPEAAAARELVEETGIVASEDSLNPLYVGDRRTHELFIYYVVLPKDQPVNSFGDEGEEVRVFSKEEFWKIANELLPAHREALEFLPREEKRAA